MKAHLPNIPIQVLLKPVLGKILKVLPKVCCKSRKHEVLGYLSPIIGMIVMPIKGLVTDYISRYPRFGLTNTRWNEKGNCLHVNRQITSFPHQQKSRFSLHNPFTDSWIANFPIKWKNYKFLHQFSSSNAFVLLSPYLFLNYYLWAGTTNPTDPQNGSIISQFIGRNFPWLTIARDESKLIIRS